MITLIGHGYIGRHIEDQLFQQNLNYKWIRHTDEVPPATSVIINAAGYTGTPNVDACELNKQETINGNVIFPVALERAHIRKPIIHIGSGCVYTGYKVGGWTEQDAPNFDFGNGSFYSGSKALGQSMLEPYLAKSYLLRIRMPFGDLADSRNLFTKLEKYPKLIDFENSLSYVNDVAKVAVHFATELPDPGVYNVCNPGSMTTKELAKALNLKDKGWFSPKEFIKHVVAPRSNCVLNTDKLTSIYPMQSVDSALQDCLRIYHG